MGTDLDSRDRMKPVGAGYSEVILNSGWEFYLWEDLRSERVASGAPSLWKFLLLNDYLVDSYTR